MAAHDFAFLDGHFQVRHRRLKDRLVGSEEWMDFETELWGTPLMGGAAFIDEMRGTVFEREFWGITLRLFDPASGQWSLYWADTWHPVCAHRWSAVSKAAWESFWARTSRADAPC